jgi:GMP synthase (glutamine-hydrolysing)
LSNRQTLVVLDFGSQYSQLITRRVRELEVYCELLPFDADPQMVQALNPQGFILSGGPASVYEAGAPQLPSYLLKLGKPVLGLCYGMQLLVHALGGQVDPSSKREYGPAAVSMTKPDAPLFGHLDTSEIDVWMSHGDRVASLPAGFEVIGQSSNSPYAAVADPGRSLYNHIK